MPGCRLRPPVEQSKIELIKKKKRVEIETDLENKKKTKEPEMERRSTGMNRTGSISMNLFGFHGKAKNEKKTNGRLSIGALDR